MGQGGKFDLSDYVDVAERIEKFREKHPDGSLQVELVELPEAFAGSFIACKATARRSPEDSAPGVDLAWEPVPGKTPYTKDSELMNAATSAIGRAIVAVLAADTKRGVASREEVRNRQAFDVKTFAASTVDEFASWDDDRRRKEWVEAVHDLFGDRQPRTQVEAEAVLGAMRKVYDAEGGV